MSKYKNQGLNARYFADFDHKKRLIINLAFFIIQLCLPTGQYSNLRSITAIYCHDTTYTTVKGSGWT